MNFNPEDLKKGIVSLLPLLKLIAARTPNKVDDQLIAFLEIILVASAAKVQSLIDTAKE